MVIGVWTASEMGNIMRKKTIAQSKGQFQPHLSYGVLCKLASLGLTSGVAVVVAMAWPQPAAAQTFKLLYTFTGLGDGGQPQATLLLHGGNLYGPTIEPNPYGG